MDKKLSSVVKGNKLKDLTHLNLIEGETYFNDAAVKGLRRRIHAQDSMKIVLQKTLKYLMKQSINMVKI